MNTLLQHLGPWYTIGASLLVIFWGTVITFGPPVFLYLFWRGFIDVHRIADALDKRDWRAPDDKYVRMPRQRLQDAQKGDSIVPSQFGR